MLDGTLGSALVSHRKRDDWLNRNIHWISETQRCAKARRLRERQKEPMILCGHGVSLRVDGGTLLIRNGLTHYPQQREEFRFFKGDPAIPPRIILLDGSGSISFDVLDWLAEQGVALVRIDWKGEVVSVFGGTGFSADPAKVRRQVETRTNPAKRIEFATRLIAEKIVNSIETLETVIPETHSRETALLRLRRVYDELQSQTPDSIARLLGIEGRPAEAYFRAWEGVPLRWKATSRRPIPDSWRAIGPRTSARAREGQKR